jgi:hypothetical protein
MKIYVALTAAVFACCLVARPVAAATAAAADKPVIEVLNATLRPTPRHHMKGIAQAKHNVDRKAWKLVVEVHDAAPGLYQAEVDEESSTARQGAFDVATVFQFYVGVDRKARTVDHFEFRTSFTPTDITIMPYKYPPHPFAATGHLR